MTAVFKEQSKSLFCGTLLLYHQIYEQDKYIIMQQRKTITLNMLFVKVPILKN